ncbi:UNVERIFIED_CONTAM: hypothetical protein FKN15_042241 [Acipenser sinensis]
MAEDYRKLRDWILENAGLEAKSMPVAIRILQLMDRERWEAYEREHTLSTWEEGVELVLSYLEAAITTTAAQVAGPPAEEYMLSPSLPAEGKCLLSPSPPAVECLLSPCPPAEGECLLVLPPQPKGEEPERPQPEWEEPERPTPEWEEPKHPTPEWEEPEHPQAKRGSRCVHSPKGRSRCVHSPKGRSRGVHSPKRGKSGLPQP